MKITCTKQEFAAICMSCGQNEDCEHCALNNVCPEHEYEAASRWLSEVCQIEEE